VSATPANPLPSEARAYRFLTDEELAGEWRARGCPTRLPDPCLLEFLRRYWQRQWEAAEAGGPTEISPRALAGPRLRLARSPGSRRDLR